MGGGGSVGTSLVNSIGTTVYDILLDSYTDTQYTKPTTLSLSLKEIK